MRYRRRSSGLLAPEEGLSMPRINLRGVERVDPASMGTLVGAKPPSPGENFLLRASLQCYYKFENGADLGEDYKGNIALTNVNAVTQSATIPSGTYAAPTATKSASFASASSQRLTATHAVSLELDDLTELTGLAWIRATTLGQRLIWEKGEYLADGHNLFTNSDSHLRGRFSNVGIDPYGGALSTSTWYFVAITYSQTADAIQLYRGTESVQIAAYGSSAAAVDKTASTAGGFAIGSTAAAGGSYWDGLICELAIFSELLTLAKLQEVQQYGMDGSG